MPWSSSDSKSKTKLASTPKAQREWKDIANSALSRGASDKSAIMQASGVLKKRSKLRGKSGSGRR